MYIFLDESGDLGFNAKNSSTHFVITLLVCNNWQTVLSFQSAIKHTLKRKLNYKRIIFNHYLITSLESQLPINNNIFIMH
jgi:hypothetical protein